METVAPEITNITYSREEVLSHPEIFVKEFSSNKDITLVIHQHGNEILVQRQKMYSDEAKDLVAEAKRLSEQDKKNGVTPEEAFDKFIEINDEIGKQISS